MNRLFEISTALLSKFSNFLSFAYSHTLQTDQIQFKYENGSDICSNWYINQLNQNFLNPPPTTVVQNTYVHPKDLIQNNVDEAKKNLSRAKKIYEQTKGLDQAHTVVQFDHRDSPTENTREQVISKCVTKTNKESSSDNTNENTLGHHTANSGVCSESAMQTKLEIDYQIPREPLSENTQAMNLFNRVKKLRIKYACKNNVEPEDISLDTQIDIIETGMDYIIQRKKEFLSNVKMQLSRKYLLKKPDDVDDTGVSLGLGVNGHVILHRNKKDRKLLAVKRISVPFHKGSFDLKPTINELYVMNGAIPHRNVLELKNAFMGNKSNDLYITMDAMRTDLHNFIHKTTEGRLEEKHAIFVFYEVLKGLLYLQNVKNVFHNDLKSENILISDNGEVKLADFGFVKNINSRHIHPSGTVLWMAPEVADRNREFDLKSDIWSFGRVLLEMIDGKDIDTYGEYKDSRTMLNLIAKLAVPPRSKYLQPKSGLAKILSRMFVIEPTNRPSLAELKLLLIFALETGLVKISRPEEFQSFFINLMPPRK